MKNDRLDPRDPRALRVYLQAVGCGLKPQGWAVVVEDGRGSILVLDMKTPLYGHPEALERVSYWREVYGIKS